MVFIVFPFILDSTMNGKYDKESMMNQAQHVWSMLDDMANNDPGAYKAFIDKQMEEKKEFMSPPEPHMCVQTTMTVRKLISII